MKFVMAQRKAHDRKLAIFTSFLEQSISAVDIYNWRLGSSSNQRCDVEIVVFRHIFPMDLGQ